MILKIVFIGEAKKAGTVKIVVNTDFLSSVVLESTPIFDTLMPKYSPDFL